MRTISLLQKMNVWFSIWSVKLALLLTGNFKTRGQSFTALFSFIFLLHTVYIWQSNADCRFCYHLGCVGCKHTDTCMANMPLLPGIKKTKEKKIMWKEAFHNSFCIQIELTVHCSCLAVFFPNRILRLKFSLGTPFLRLATHILMKQCQTEYNYCFSSWMVGTLGN